MLPSKYVNIDVRELFPDFRPDKVTIISIVYNIEYLKMLLIIVQIRLKIQLAK